MKLGQLYLDGGVWNGKRVVSRSWVEASTMPHPMNAKSTDGYNWHTSQIKAGDRTYREYEANGNGGQLLMVLPELDLVVFFTAGNTATTRSGAASGKSSSPATSSPPSRIEPAVAAIEIGGSPL